MVGFQITIKNKTMAHKILVYINKLNDVKLKLSYNVFRHYNKKKTSAQKETLNSINAFYFVQWSEI